MTDATPSATAPPPGYPPPRRRTPAERLGIAALAVVAGVTGLYLTFAMLLAAFDVLTLMYVVTAGGVRI